LSNDFALQCMFVAELGAMHRFAQMKASAFLCGYFAAVHTAGLIPNCFCIDCEFVVFIALWVVCL